MSRERGDGKMLKIDHMTVAYKNVPTVLDFSMDMKPGQIIALVGESGSGKTTVIRAVMGLLPAAGKVTEGDIVFDGKSLLSFGPEQWRTFRGREISDKLKSITGQLEEKVVKSAKKVSELS